MAAVKDTMPDCWVPSDTGFGVAVSVTEMPAWAATLTTMVLVPVMPAVSTTVARTV